MVHTHVSALIVFVITLTKRLSVLLYQAYKLYTTCVVSHIVNKRTGLKSRLIWDWTAVIHTISANSSSLYVLNWKRPRTCSRISVHYYEMSYDTCWGTNAWPLIGSKFAKNSSKLDKVDNTRCTWPLQAKNRYDLRLANRRAPYVWFVLGFRMYGVPVFGTKVTR